MLKRNGKMKSVLICLDRDGTIDYDKKYHLGHQRGWKSKVRILSNVVKGLKILRKIQGVKIYIITNQTGVAIKDFPLLTEKRAREVCQYIMDRLEDKGIKLEGYEICGKASHSYVKKRSNFKFEKKLVGNFSCIKPKPGMINSILNKEGVKRRDVKIYVIGDRFLDIKTALNIKGFGILVPFKNEPGEKEKVEKLKSKNKYIAKDFLDAAEFVVKKEK